MKNILKYSFFIALLVSFVSCEEDGVLPVDIPEAISFNAGSVDYSIQPGGSTYNLEVQSSTTSTAARTFSFTLDEDASTGLPGDYTLDGGSVTISAGELIGSVGINFDYDAVPLGVTRQLVFNLDEVGGGAVMNNSRTSTTVNYSAFCPNNSLLFSLEFDSWPEEIYWQLIQMPAGDVIAFSGDNFLTFGAYSGMTGSTSQLFCLEDGDYIFEIYDQFGDGGGPWSFTDSDGNVIVSSNGAYGGYLASPFTL